VLCAWALAQLGRGAMAEDPYRALRPPGEAPRPAVLLVPGCSGFVPLNGFDIYEDRARELLAAGHVVVFVDYVGPRHLDSCARVTHAEIGGDVLDAVAWTRRQPGIDADRIAVIGWSFGGGAVLAALRAMPAGARPIDKAITFYPDCRRATPWTAGGVPVLMLLGGSDDVAPAALCDPVIRGAPPGSLRAVTYPTARHAFDVRSLPARVQYPFGTLGYDAAAARAAWEAALGFLAGRKLAP